MSETEKSQIRALQELLDNDDLDGFEKQFAQSMVRNLKDNPERSLSDAQSDKLEQIWRRHCQESD